MAEVFVITCNDSVEHVVIGDRDVADHKMEGLALQYYQRNQAHYQVQHDRFAIEQTAYKSYRRHVHWAVRPTPYSVGLFVGIVDERENELKRQKHG